MSRFYPIVVLFFTAFSLSGQNPADNKPQKNLVPNGSFENYRKKSDNIRMAIPWQPIASIDYYHNPLDNDTTVQKGAYEGYCYTGFRFQKRYKEFLQVKLAEPLHRGTTYEITMQIRLAFWSNATLKSFGVLFSKAGYRRPADAVRANMVDTMVKKGGLMKGFQWFTFHGFYKADGGEKYLTIGNFAPEIKKDMVRMNLFKLGFKESYYFVDDVSLVKYHEEDKVVEEVVGSVINPEDSTLQVNKNIQVGEKVALKNLFFENGKYYLLPESNQELNKLAQYLLRNPSMEIRINGHSDNSGLKFKNQKISELRAREVFEYLIKKGVQNKMYFKGFGSTQPIASNDTDDGRAKNRRVEFEIIKK
ncbi:MAG: OmpA/MotB protein [Bacteroidetes bacterium]|jgi:outer membrane protein OmpA-like peptidoglycan-associated protein|nr:OmpA/MotB protein [Bacteroidota bacterium]